MFLLTLRLAGDIFVIGGVVCLIAHKTTKAPLLLWIGPLMIALGLAASIYEVRQGFPDMQERTGLLTKEVSVLQPDSGAGEIAEADKQEEMDDSDVKPIALAAFPEESVFPEIEQDADGYSVYMNDGAVQGLSFSDDWEVHQLEYLLSVTTDSGVHATFLDSMVVDGDTAAIQAEKDSIEKNWHANVMLGSIELDGGMSYLLSWKYEGNSYLRVFQHLSQFRDYVQIDIQHQGDPEDIDGLLEMFLLQKS